MQLHQTLLKQAVQLARDNARAGGRPFGAVLAVGEEVISTGVNEVVHSHDPTTHAEMSALRTASRRLGKTDLAGSVAYASGHPCPMCLAALVLANVNAVYYAFDNADAEPFGFSSAALYARLQLPLFPPPLPLTRLDVGLDARDVYGSQSASEE